MPHMCKFINYKFVWDIILYILYTQILSHAKIKKPYSLIIVKRVKLKLAFSSKEGIQI